MDILRSSTQSIHWNGYLEHQRRICLSKLAPAVKLVMTAYPPFDDPEIAKMAASGLRMSAKDGFERDQSNMAAIP
jgi:hypothetical protein